MSSFPLTIFLIWFNCLSFKTPIENSFVYSACLGLASLPIPKLLIVVILLSNTFVLCHGKLDLNFSLGLVEKLLLFAHFVS